MRVLNSDIESVSKNFRRALMWILAALTVFAIVGTVRSQQNSTSNKPDQNLKSSARVNPLTLAMEFRLPFGGYKGRSGNSVPIFLNYSSKLWEMEKINDRGETVQTSHQDYDYIRYHSIDVGPFFSKKSASGWTSSLMPVTIVELTQLYDEYGQIPEGFLTAGMASLVGSTEGPENLTEWDCYWSETVIDYSSSCMGLAYYNFPVCCISDSICIIGSANPAIECIFGSSDPGGGWPGPLPTPEPFPTPIPPPTPAPPIPHKVHRVRLQMPDGSTAEFRKDDKVYNCIDNHSECYTQPTPDGTYLSVDGSGMKFVRREQLPNSEIRDVLYFPDGSRYLFPDVAGQPTLVADKAVKFIDKDGNEALYDPSSMTWTDTLGREIVDPLKSVNTVVGIPAPTGIGTFPVTIPGLDEQDITYSVTWAALSDSFESQTTSVKKLGQDLCNSVLAAPNNSPALFENQPDDWMFDQIHGRTRYITKYRACSARFGWGGDADFDPIVLAGVTTPNGEAYSFRYNEYGEITKIVYPTGAYERFVYGKVNPIGFSSLEVFSQGNRGVVKRFVSEDGVSEQEWTYTVGSTTAPDGSKIEKQMHVSNMSVWGFEDPLSGMPKEERKKDTNGVLRSRTLNDWITADPLTGGSTYARRDPRLRRSVTINFEPDSASALATLTENEYDENGSSDPEFFSHLNVKRTKSYHYVVIGDKTTVDDEALSWSTIEGWFTSDKLASITETDYSYDSGYKARGILGRPVETRVLNPGNPSDVLAKTQFVYDEGGDYFDNNYTTTNWENPNSDLRGNVTTTRTWVKETDTWLETHTMYDNFGNVRKVWDASGDANKFVETQYDSAYKYAYPTKVISPAPDPSNTTGTNQASEVTTTYDFTTGLPLTVTDAKDLTTSADDQVITMEYDDPLLRPSKIIPPSGAGIVEFEYGNEPGNFFIKTRKQITSESWNESVSLLDGLGRVRQTQAKDQHKTFYLDTEFDEMGRVRRTSIPYLQGEAAKWVETDYDAVGRVLEVTSPTISEEPEPAKIKSEYDLATAGNEIGTVVIGINQAGKKGRSVFNALGQLIRFDEPNQAGELGPIANPNQPTHYTYDRLGKLRKVSQGDQSRYFMYDGLGRLIRIRQPEQDTNSNLALTDPITGNSQWTAAFSYDNNGNLISSTDAKGATIAYTYDRLNRLTTRNYTISQTSDPKETTYQTSNVTFKYDGLLSPLPNGQPQSAGSFSKGKLTEVGNGASLTQTTSFDNQGRALSTQQIVDGHVFPFQYEYNLAGKVTSQTYPSGRVVENDFDESGDLSSVASQRPGQVQKYHARNFLHNANGDIVRLQLGNGRWENYQYNARNQLTQLGLGTSATATNLWKVNYDYGKLDQQGILDVSKNDGNIAKQTISVPGLANPFVQAYVYDSINRLTEAKESFGAEQTWKQTYGYDRYGNRTGFSEIIGQTATTLNDINHPDIDPTNNRFLTSQGYEYDYSGNLIQDAEGRKFKFDAENKQREVTDLNGNVLSTYSYDADGRRVKKTVTGSQESTIFIYDAFGKMVAEYSNIQAPTPRTSYLTTDIINSVRVVTDQFGQVVSRRDFKPFGEELYANTPNRSINQKYGFGDEIRKKFAGYDRDSETDLDFAEARYYNGKHGRFTAVDPLAASGRSSNPQTFNRYVYAGNNPTKRIDPNGLDWCVSTGVTKMGSGVAGEGRPYTEYAWSTRCTSKSPPVRSHVVFINAYTDGTPLGKYVALDPFTRDFKPVDSLADAQSAVRQYKMQAALDFVVGIAEANSLVLELTGAAEYVARTGGDSDSPYQIGLRAGQGLEIVSGALGAAGLVKAVTSLAAKYGLKGMSKEIRQLLRGAKMCCFVAGTPIHTDKGLVPIESIKVGDKVLSYDERTGEFEYKPVARTFIAVKENIVKIKIRGEKLLTTTTEHPFYVKRTHKARSSLPSGDDEEGEWLVASELRVGQKVLRPDGHWARITTIVRSIEPILVYNFEVEGNHNYFVGEFGILSHNCSRARGLREAVEAAPTNMLRPQVHHDLPQLFRERFSQAGIDIDLPEFTRWVEGGWHQSWSRAFNDAWENFFSNTPNPTREQVVDFMNELRRNPRFASRPTN